jgi:hypothetical protein
MSEVEGSTAEEFLELNNAFEGETNEEIACKEKEDVKSK